MSKKKTLAQRKRDQKKWREAAMKRRALNRMAPLINKKASAVIREIIQAVRQEKEYDYINIQIIDKCDWRFDPDFGSCKGFDKIRSYCQKENLNCKFEMESHHGSGYDEIVYYWYELWVRVSW